MDRSRKFYRFHLLLRSYLRHYTIMPSDCNENYCSQHRDFGAVVGALVNDADAVDIGHQRQCNDCYGTQHSDYCYCAAAVDTVDFVRLDEHSCHNISVDYSDALQQRHYLRDCEHFAK